MRPLNKRAIEDIYIEVLVLGDIKVGMLNGDVALIAPNSGSYWKYIWGWCKGQLSDEQVKQIRNPDHISGNTDC